MSDYKFDILSELVKHDDYERNEVLFGGKCNAYEQTLRILYENKLIGRLIIVDEEDILKEDYKTKVTLKGRNYFYDVLMPQKQGSSSQTIIKEAYIGSVVAKGNNIDQSGVSLSGNTNTNNANSQHTANPAPNPTEKETVSIARKTLFWTIIGVLVMILTIGVTIYLSK